MSTPASRKNAPGAAASLHLKELPDDFEPSAEEANLQQMYVAIRAFEKEALRLKEKKARDKIFDNTTLPSSAADDMNDEENDRVVVKEEDQAEEPSSQEVDNTATSTKKKTIKRRARKKKGAPQTHHGDEDEDNDDDISDHDSDIDMDDGDDNQDDLARRRAAKLEALRLEVQRKKEANKTDADVDKQEELRNELLTTNDDSIMEEGPALKKRKRDLEPAPGQSILDGLRPALTPPHEFSKKLNLLDWKGKIIFPTYTDEPAWVPPPGVSSPNDGAFLAELPDFDINQASNGQGNNTVAIKFMAPADSKRFSINIAAPNQKDMDSILFHFNPRQRGKRSSGMLVVNDKQSGVWGRAVQLPLSQVPIMFGQESVTLIIQINGDGFDVFIEGEHCVRLEHRTELPSKSCSLWLQFPSSDDSLKPENWTVYKTWWGNKESLVDENKLSRVAGYKAFDSVHPRKLFLSGLDKIRTERDAEIRRANLERQFMRYAGDRGVSTIIPLHSTYAFVEFETERGADLALQELSGTLPYKINRARRSKHEALTEKREAETAAAQGKTQSTGDW
jgi:Galactoside-binding lectin